MRHLKNFGSDQSPNKLFKESYSDEYYYILDIRDALGSLAPSAEDYFIVSTNNMGVDLDYTESSEELKFEAIFSEDRDDYEIETDTDAILSDMLPYVKPSEESPSFTEDEIQDAIENAVVKNGNGSKFVHFVDASDCSVEWHVVRGSSSYREFRVEASLEGKARASGCDWDGFVESVMKELGSKTAGKIDYR